MTARPPREIGQDSQTSATRSQTDRAVTARAVARAQLPPAPPVAPRFSPLRRDVGFFIGRGGTIGWLASPAALAVVDTQFPETAAACLAGLPGRAGRTIDVVINTHHHADHTSGNGVFRAAARTLVAHEAVPGLQRAAARRSNQETEPVCADRLFTEQWRFDAGDEIVSARHFGPAHTRGDIAVCFERANVVHVGDLVFNRIYPVVDRPGGASLRHWIDVLEALAASQPADALYLFGHGKAEFGVTGRRADVLGFRDYLSALLEHVGRELQAGKSKEAVLALDNLPGFPDYHVPPGAGSRMAANLAAACDELSAAN